MLLENEGKPLRVCVRREEVPEVWVEMELTVTPSCWSGQGLLGCNVHLAPGMKGGEKLGPAYSIVEVCMCMYVYIDVHG